MYFVIMYTKMLCTYILSSASVHRSDASVINYSGTVTNKFSKSESIPPGQANSKQRPGGQFKTSANNPKSL